MLTQLISHLVSIIILSEAVDDISYYRKQSIPSLEFDLFHIKTPQLIGIIAGCLVFTITIAVVIYLLIASGTISGFLQEIRSGSTSSIVNNSKGLNLKPTDTLLPQIKETPRLHDHLIEASKKLPRTLDIPEIKGKTITLQQFNFQDTLKVQQLFEASNGSPQYHESSYNPLRIWGWIQRSRLLDKSKQIWDDLLSFKLQLSMNENISFHVNIIDNEMNKPIGMITLSENKPEYLTILIG